MSRPGGKLCIFVWWTDSGRMTTWGVFRRSVTGRHAIGLMGFNATDKERSGTLGT